MGQAGSQPAQAPPRAHRAHTLPHEPLRHAPRVLPSLTESPRLRSTDNGAILHSGGTISGRRPASIVPETTRTPHGHVHTSAYRSRSAGATSDSELRARERDPLHRSYTNLDMRHNDSEYTSDRSRSAGATSDSELRARERDPLHRSYTNLNMRHNDSEYTSDRSRSAGATSDSELRARERDPLHRSYTNLDMRHNDSEYTSDRSRSAGATSDSELRARERDPLHRSYTNLDMRHNDSEYTSDRSRSAGATSDSELRARERDPLHRSYTNLNMRHNDSEYTSDRSRSAGATSDSELRARERDPLHRSYTNLDMRHNDNGSINKRFGSEPDLREEEPKQRCKKHFRKKYRAPPPPTNDHREGSSPDSSEGNARPEPQRKLRLFRTRHETKKLSHEPEVARNSYTAYKSLDIDQSFEKRYRSPCKDKDQHFKYPDTHDMIQSTASLKREQHIIQNKQDFRKRTDRVSGCRAKTSKTNDSEAWKTPLLNRNFRHSERFKKVETEQPVLRREKTFDTLVSSERDSESPRTMHESRMKAIGEQLKGSRLQPGQPLGKSLPSLLTKNNEEKDEFQVELKKATSRIRNELGTKINVSENKTSQNKTTQKPNPTKTPSKVKESSLKTNVSKPETKTAVSRRPLTRVTESKLKTPVTQSKVNTKPGVTNGDKTSKEKGRTIPDRGQASGKESTPEHSPTRKITPVHVNSKEKQKPAPSKQFYFGMIESKQFETQDHLKDFPGLGSPIIEEISNFHAIEQKLLGYHAEDAEFEEFNAKLKEDCRVKNLSSESALSSDASDSDGSLGIALRLRPTLPKKQRAVPRFSPAAAWRQLATLDAHLASETQPLAVETKVSADISAESSPRSDQSADKSGDSGISGDHAHSDQRIESPSRQVPDTTPAWTPQQDLGDSSSDGVGGAPHLHSLGVATYSPGAQPFSLSLPRDQDKGKQIQQGFNSLQKLRKSVSGALGAALGSRRFDLEHEPMLQEPEQNWFLTKSAPNSLSNPLLYQPPARAKATEEDIKEETSTAPSEKEDPVPWRPGINYLSWGGHVMYLPPAPAAPSQPLSMLGPIDRPVRSKSSGSLEVAARAARAAALANEMRERERSASPDVARALPARVQPVPERNARSRAKRFTFQSTVRQLERRRLAEKLSKEADLKEQQRRTELEAMRRVEEEFQRKRAREKANIRQQLRLVSSGAASMPLTTHHGKARDEPDGSCRASPAPERPRDRQRHSNASSEISARSKSTTPVRCVELSEWRTESAARVYRDWGGAGVGLPAHAHPPACARMPIAHQAQEVEAFSGSPRSDNYRLEFARGRSPRTPRPPRLLSATRSPSTSGSELSLRQPIKIRW